jgi:hypothetical protein
VPLRYSMEGRQNEGVPAVSSLSIADPRSPAQYSCFPPFLPATKSSGVELYESSKSDKQVTDAEEVVSIELTDYVLFQKWSEDETE